MSEHRSASTLLIVDDDPAMVRLLSTFTARAFGDDMHIETATDPQAALERIDQGGIDILLTDLDMPEVGGIDVLKSAKRRNACTQVIVLTGHSSGQALLSALELGASDYVLKPVDQETLLSLLRQAHRRRLRWQQALVATWQQKKYACATE